MVSGFFFFFQAEDGIRDIGVTGVQTCALPIYLDQYRQANFDALDEKVKLQIPGLKVRGDVWIGEGVEIDDVEGVEGPAFIGNYATISPDASVGPYSVLNAGVTLRERARVSRSVIDASSYIGRSAVVEGAILGRGCDVRL